MQGYTPEVGDFGGIGQAAVQSLGTRRTPYKGSARTASREEQMRGDGSADPIQWIEALADSASMQEQLQDKAALVD